ncbi:MAG: FkbM family methyltransferase [Salinarimonas sp.]
MNRPFLEQRSHSWLRRQIGSVRKLWFRLKHGRSPFEARYFDTRFVCTLGDSVAKGIAVNTYDNRQLRFLMDWARREKPDRFYDIGANLGLYACVLVGQGAVATAVAFEPDRNNRRLLERNIALNRLEERIAVRDYALGRQEAELAFREGAQDNRGTSRIVGEGKPNAATAGQYTVRVMPFDRVEDVSSETLMIKMDCEGFESEVLAGMQQALKRNRCLIQIEAFDDDNAETLKGLGYRHIGTIHADQYWVNF